MQMIFTYSSRSTERKADSGALKEAMTFLMTSNKGNTEESVEMLPLYILPRNSKMMAFLRISSYTNIVATGKYKEITTSTYIPTHTLMYIRNLPRMIRSLKLVTSTKPASW